MLKDVIQAESKWYQIKIWIYTENEEDQSGNYVDKYI